MSTLSLLSRQLVMADPPARPPARRREPAPLLQAAGPDRQLARELLDSARSSPILTTRAVRIAGQWNPDY